MERKTTTCSSSNDFTTCTICLQVFDNPKSLPCIHSFCLKCLEHHFKDKSPGDEVPCPACKQQFKVPREGLTAVSSHHFMQHLVEAKTASSKSKDETSCQMCSEENTETEAAVTAATVFCIDCAEYLCDKCSRLHSRATMKGGGHQVRPFGPELEQELIQLRGSYCDKHDDKQVELYCCECQENICVLCFAVSHRNHESMEIADAANTFSVQIESDDQQVMSQIRKIRKLSKDKENKRNEFVASLDAVKREVTVAGSQVSRLVDKQMTMLSDDVEVVKSEDAKKAETVEESYQLALVAMESFHTYSRELLEKGRPSDVTRAASELHKRATELLDNDVTSVEYVPPHVTFSPVDVTPRTKFNLIGQIMMGNGQLLPGATQSLAPLDSLLKQAAETEQGLRDQVSCLQEEMRQRLEKENKMHEKLELQIRQSGEREFSLSDQLKQLQSQLAQLQLREIQLQTQLKENSQGGTELQTQLARLQQQLKLKSEDEELLRQQLRELQLKENQLKKSVQEKCDREESLVSQLKENSENEALLKSQLAELRLSESTLNELVAQSTAKETELRRQMEELSRSEQTLNVKLKEENERRWELQKNLEMFERHMKQRQMGQVHHTLPDGEPVLGLSPLDNRLFVLRGLKSTEQVEVYDTDSYRLQRRLTVPRLLSPADMIACVHNRCLYISDSGNQSIHRLSMPGAAIRQWPVNDDPARLSVTDRQTLIVTCDKARKIKEFGTDGKLLRDLSLPQDVVSPWQTVQLPSGHYIVCHGDASKQAHRVCLVGSDGRTVKAYDNRKCLRNQQINLPVHLALDSNEFVYVADCNNHRVLLMSPALTYVREVVSRDQLKWRPVRLCLDAYRRRLYVADNEWKDGKFVAGRAVVSAV